MGRASFLLLLFLLVTSLLVAGCSPQPGKGAEDACVELCRQALGNGRNLSQGPCLADPLAQYPSIVCDVAHSPRAPVDDLPANQCASYRSGKAGSFVEVTSGCAFIRTG